MRGKAVIRVGFGGGCHWCTEAVFQALRDVQAVAQGFIRSDPPHDTFSEAVDVTFDPDEIALDTLVRVHLATHASTSDHKMRGKYRSAVYVQGDDLANQATRALEQASIETGLHFVTQVLPHREFKPSDQRFHEYYATNPDRLFCKTYINPKLAKIRQDFSKLLKENDSVG